MESEESAEEYTFNGPEEVSEEDFDSLATRYLGVDEASDEESVFDEDEEDVAFVDMKSISSYIQEVIVIKPENRRTTNRMSKYEMTECCNIRAVQISQFNNCMVDITGLSNEVLMAKRELMMRKCPLTLRRHVGTLKNKSGEVEQYYEYWDPNEMVFSTQYPEAMK